MPPDRYIHYQWHAQLDFCHAQWLLAKICPSTALLPTRCNGSWGRANGLHSAGYLATHCTHFTCCRTLVRCLSLIAHPFLPSPLSRGCNDARLDAFALSTLKLQPRFDELTCTSLRLGKDNQAASYVSGADRDGEMLRCPSSRLVCCLPNTLDFLRLVPPFSPFHPTMLRLRNDGNRCPPVLARGALSRGRACVQAKHQGACLSPPLHLSERTWGTCSSLPSLMPSRAS